MDQKIPVMAKKIWNIVRVAFIMLRKGICKRKIVMDINLMMKRGKIAGKALSNLILHHHHHHGAATQVGPDVEFTTTPSVRPGEYEFSCSSTPLYRQYFPTKRNNKNKHHYKYKHMPSFEDLDNNNNEVNMEAVSKVLETMVSSTSSDDSLGASPLLAGLGFGRSPMPTRQLRITDSPFPVLQNGDKEDHKVDQEAEDFIERFYSQLKQQKYY